MAVKAYVRAIPKIPCDTRTYMSAIDVIFDEARVEIGTDWAKSDVMYIDSGSIITVFITYGTNS
jgi:hypothetical protein